MGENPPCLERAGTSRLGGPMTILAFAFCLWSSACPDRSWATKPMNRVKDLIRQQLIAWEGAEVVYIEVPLIVVAVVKAIRINNDDAEWDLLVDGETHSVGGIWECLDASRWHVACRDVGWIMYFHPDIVSRVRAAGATCSEEDEQFVEI